MPWPPWWGFRSAGEECRCAPVGTERGLSAFRLHVLAGLRLVYLPPPNHDKDRALAYPVATDRDIAFFAEHGWLAVADAIDPGDLDLLTARCDEILAKKESMAFDWAWEKGTPRDQREFKIVQASPTR